MTPWGSKLQQNYSGKHLGHIFVFVLAQCISTSNSGSDTESLPSCQTTLEDDSRNQLRCGSMWARLGQRTWAEAFTRKILLSVCFYICRVSFQNGKFSTWKKHSLIKNNSIVGKYYWHCNPYNFSPYWFGNTCGNRGNGKYSLILQV